MKALNKFLKDNPEFLSKYVSVGYNLLGKTIQPLNRFMVHLLEIQGIDPNTKPGDAIRKNLAVAVEQKMGIAADDFEPDFNFSAMKGFEKVSAQLAHLKLNHENFKKATDLTFAQDPVQKAAYDALKKAPSVEFLSEEKAYENSLDELKEFMDKHDVAIGEVPLDIESAKKAVKTIAQYAKIRLSQQKKRDERKKVVSGLKKNDKSKIIKTFGKKATFRRVED